MTSTTAYKYNLEDEEKYLESYLETTTAISTKRQDGDDDGDVNTPNGDNNNDGAGNNSNNEDGDDNDDDDFIGKRVYCCGTSRSLYCPECCRVLVPKSRWPRRMIEQLQRRQCKNNLHELGSTFPFQSMDIVLGVKERRTSSTGIQMMCISKMIAEAAESSRKKRQNQQQHHREVVENENEAINEG